MRKINKEVFKVAFCLCFLVIMSSCKSHRNVAYFQNAAISDSTLSFVLDKVALAPRIKVDDQLSISVTAVDPKTIAVFNLPALTYLTPGQMEIQSNPSLQTYLVGTDGAIEFPVIGKLKVEGLTSEECRVLLTDKISHYVDSPLVTIQFMNFHYSVLGEVNSPGTFEATYEFVSILDALGKAKDMTIYGDRCNVMLIRNQNGRNEIFRLDLTDTSLLQSPVYYLQQNDVIYVTPNKSRQKNARYSQTDSYNVSLFSAVVSTMSVISSLLIALLVK